MSLSTLLRRVDPQACEHAERVRLWAEQGHCVRLDAPARTGSYLRFTARNGDGHWSGLVCPHGWLAWALPGLEALLAQGCSDQEIARLFALAARPLALPALEGLHYSAIDDVDVLCASALPAQPMPAVQTPCGRLWLTRLPARSPRTVDPFTSWVSALPIPVSWIIGHSRLCAHSLARLADQDVLHIAECDWQVRVSGQPVGRFDLQREGLMMSETSEDVSVTPDGPADDSNIEASRGEALPARVEFVLHEQVCTLTQLAGWMEGQVMPLAPDSVQRVQVRANGHLVAEGELVRWEDRLGVELHTLHTLHRGQA